MPNLEVSPTPRRHVFSAVLSGLLMALLMVPAVSLVTTSPVLAQDSKREDRNTLNDLQERAAQLNQQIRDNKRAAEQKEKEAASLAGQIDRIEADIDVTETRIEDTKSHIAVTEDEIHQTEQQIGERQRELDEQVGHQHEAIRVLYETRQDELLFLVAAESLSDAIEHGEYLVALEEQIEGTISHIEELKRGLQDQKQQLDDKRRSLDALRQQHEAFQVGLATEQQRKESLLVRTQAQQAEFESKVEDARKLNAQVESQMAAIRARLTKESGPGVIQAKDRGTSTVGLQWPTDYRYVSTYFGGSTPFQPNGGHGGLDLVNSSGTPIYASADGTITAVESMTYNGKLYAYGNYVVIGHNARFSSLYAHLQSFAVAPGDEVKRGDIIGYMGSTGWSTGPHLHYEIWEYSSRINPLNYLP